MDNKDKIIEEIKEQSKAKTLSRFISTHPDEDHFQGIHWLDDVKPIQNFYVKKIMLSKVWKQIHSKDTAN